MVDQPAAEAGWDAYLVPHLELLDIGIAVADDTGRYLAVNRRACELFGRTREELLGAGPDDIVDPQRREAVQGQWAAFLRDGSQTGVFEVAIPDGGVRFVRFTARANFVPGRHCSFLTDAMSPEDPGVAPDKLLVMCAWTKRVKQGDRWLPLEEYLEKVHGLNVSHGLCPDALAELMRRDGNGMSGRT